MNIVMSDEYDVAPQFILRMRRHAGLSQRQVAAGLCRSQGHVQRMETRQRSIEIVEFCRIADMCGLDPVEALRELVQAWEQMGRGAIVTTDAAASASACSTSLARSRR